MNSIVQLAEQPEKILQAWQQLQAQHQGPLPLRIRDAAHQLGVTEAQLLATRCGQGVTRLCGDWPDMIQQLPRLGKIMSLVRNEHAVHERKGEYANISFEGPNGKIGVVANETIDLRIFLYRWAIAFAVVEEVKNKNESKTDVIKQRFSIQFFDKHGYAIQKIYLLDQISNIDFYHEFVTRYKDTNQDTYQPVEVLPEPKPNLPDSEINVQGLRQEWSELKDTHDFYMLIKKFNAGRLQSLRLAGTEWAVPVNVQSIQHSLERASQIALPIMIFVGNDNIIQIHTGKVEQIKSIHGWLNVMDPEFNLHIHSESMHTCWLVRKPTVDGIVTSLELYDKNEQLILTMFGKRKPGIPEDLTWRALAESMISPA